jgi:hypothetical protein
MKVLIKERDGIISDGTNIYVAIWHITGVLSWFLGSFTMCRSRRCGYISSCRR